MRMPPARAAARVLRGYTLLAILLGLGLVLWRGANPGLLLLIAVVAAGGLICDRLILARPAASPVRDTPAVAVPLPAVPAPATGLPLLAASESVGATMASAGAAALALEDRWRRLAEASSEALVIHDAGIILDANETTARIFGYRLEELVGKPVLELTAPADRASVIERAHAGGEYHYEVFCLRKDGTTLPVAIYSKSIPYEGRRVRVAAIRDISEQRRAAAALRASEARYRQMFEQNQAIQLLIDAESGAIVDANPAACAFYGYPAARFKSMNIDDVICSSCEQMIEELERAVEAAETRYSFHHQLASGEIRDVEVQSSPVDVEGRTLLYSIVQDVTARKRAEAALQIQRDFALQVMNTMGQGLTVSDAEGRLTYVNPADAAIVGMAPEDLIGRALRDTIFADDQANLRAMQARRRAGETTRRETRLRRADGSAVYVLITAVPQCHEGVYTGDISVITDLTEYRQAEEALRESEAAIRALYAITAGPDQSVAEKIAALLAMGCRHFGLDTGVLTRVQGDDYAVVAVHSANPELRDSAVYPLDATYLSATVLAEAPIGIERAVDSPWPSRRGYARFATEAYLGTRVLVAGQVYGTLSFASAKPRAQAFKTTDKEFLLLMAGWLGGEIARAPAPSNRP